ncbi:MAG: hypothetical protein CMH54_12285 [Myxococcales bacterium]|nr:hypothetical protein [Myxococcales bacterium]
MLLAWVGACADYTDPQTGVFDCSNMLPCAEGYFCSPLLEVCIAEDDEIPCVLSTDCPEDKPTCFQNDQTKPGICISL